MCVCVGVWAAEEIVATFVQAATVMFVKEIHDSAIFMVP